MRTAVRIFFKEIRLLGLENLPKDKPIILAANHNSAFMDAIVVAVFIEPQIYFLTRSDVFNTPLKNWILKKMNLIPIYRLQEGAENLQKNEKTFADCNRILARNESIIIFSEGICIQEKRLQKLKKGTARIAFGAALHADLKIDIQVVPVGINYNKPAQFRSNLLLNFAAPIAINNYKDLLREDSNKAIITFTRDLEQAMLKTIVHLTDKHIDSFYDQLAEVYGEEFRAELNWYGDNRLYFQSIRTLGELLNNLKQSEPEQFDSLKQETAAYFSSLEHLKLKDKAIKRYEQISTGNLVIRFMIALLFLPVHLISLTFNYWPYLLAYSIAKKTCKHIEFFASVMIGTAAFMYLIMFVVVGIVMGTYLDGFAYKFLAFLILPISAYFNLKFYSFLLNLNYDWKVKNNKAKAQALVQQRSQLIAKYKTIFISRIKSRSN